MSPRARRALIVVHSYYLRDTRPRRVAETLAGAGWDVSVVCARDAGELAHEIVRGVNIRRLPARRRRGSKLRYVYEYLSFTAMALATVTGLHGRRKFDVVYVLGVPNMLVFSALVPRLSGARVLLDVRDPLPEFFRSKYGFGEDHPVVRALLLEERLSCRFASHVMTAHETFRDLLRRTGIGADGITILLNAPDRRIFSPDVALSGRDPEDRTLLYAGTVAARYGVDVALEAVGILRDEIPALRLRIVGDGDLVPGLHALARRLGITDRLSIERPVPLDRVPELVGAAWLGVNTHRTDPLMRFCFSTKVFEWCLLGLPVVCSRTEAFERTFGEDELLYVTPGDPADVARAIREAHAHPSALAERAEHARKAVTERLDWTRESDKLLAAVVRD